METDTAPAADKNTVLILDGEQRSALAAVRSLGRRGLTVLVGSECPHPVSGASRYCRKSIRYSDPSSRPDDFISDIKNTIQRENVNLLLPMTDVSVHMVLKHESLIRPLVSLPFVRFEQYTKAVDKTSLTRMAEEMGIPVPATQYIAGPDSLGENLRFPLVLRPGASLVPLGTQVRGVKVEVVNSREELEQSVRGNDTFRSPFMIQEKLTGEGLGVFALFHEGKPLTIFGHRRLREKPPWGGVSVLCESTEPDPDAAKYAIRILEKLQWHGAAMVEFKRKTKSGEPAFIEINPRLWGSLQLAIDAGVDFPYHLYLLGRGERPPSVTQYRYARLRWLLGDIDNLYISMRTGRMKKKLHDRTPKRSVVLRDFFAEFGKGSSLQVWRRDDPKPFFRELRQYL